MILLAQAACNGATPPATKPGGPAPFRVTVSIDSARASSALLGTAGGTLTASAADGTGYALVFPAKALLADTEITMTPIVALDGLVVGGGTLAGVHLEPEGLRLYEFARLTVTPPVSKRRGAIAFAYRARGEEFHLFPLDTDPDALSMRLLHFSGHAVSYGAETAVPVLQVKREEMTPAEWEAGFEQELQALLAVERDRQVQGLPPDPEVLEMLEAAQLAHYQTIILPLLGRIATECSFAEANLSKALGWSRWASLVDGGTRFASEIGAVDSAFRQGIEICWRELTSPCLDADDGPKRARLLTIARQAAMLGMEGYDESTVRRCGSSWMGTSTCTSVTHGTADAEVTWVAVPPDPLSPPGVEVFRAEGTVTTRSTLYSLLGCSVYPSSGPIDPEDGDLRFLFDGTSVDYEGTGGSLWPTTVTCEDGSYEAQLVTTWFVAPSTPFVAGATEIFGSYSDDAISCSYRFTR